MNRIFFSSLAAAVLATALAGCGSESPVSLTPAPSPAQASAPGPRLTEAGRRIDWAALKPGDPVPATSFVPPPLPPDLRAPAAVQERRIAGRDRVVIQGIPGFDGATCNPNRRHDAALPIVTSRRVDGRLQVPALAEVGWDASTARPGSGRGVTLLTGHLTAGPVGSYQGPLWGAECLPTGSEIKVVWKGRTFTYRTTGVVSKYERGRPPATIVDPAGPSRIALITCTGPPRVNRERGGLWWSRNAAVWAELVR